MVSGNAKFIARRDILKLFVHECPKLHQNIAFLPRKHNPPNKKNIETDSAFYITKKLSLLLNLSPLPLRPNHY